MSNNNKVEIMCESTIRQECILSWAEADQVVGWVGLDWVGKYKKA